MSGSPDWKPRKRKKASRADWATLREQKAGPCRVCRVQQGDELHHLVPRARTGLGDDVAANLVPLCRLCHELIENRDEQASVRLGASLTLDERLYVIHRKGHYYLADRYRVVQRLGDYIVTSLEAA